jgi:hypothetical protein
LTLRRGSYIFPSWLRILLQHHPIHSHSSISEYINRPTNLQGHPPRDPPPIV